MKTLKVTITNLQQIKNGVVCGAKVAFEIMEAGRVLDNEGWVKGWAVIRNNPWHLVGC